VKLHLRFLRQVGDLREALQNDGWQLEQELDASVVAWHPEARDQRAARTRLHQLGLLTSSSLRIDFLPPS
jgi:hypothetical protein